MLELLDQVTEEHLPALQAPLEGRLQLSPYNFRFTLAHALRVMVHNSVTGVIVAIHYRMQSATGEVLHQVLRFTPASDRVHDEEEFQLGEGYLLNLVAIAEAGSPKIGQTFVKVDVIHGRGGAATLLATIAQDYVTEMQPVAWPGSPIRSSLEAGGSFLAINGTAPAAGTELLETVPTGAEWEIVSLWINLIASATAATRRVKINVVVGGRRMAEVLLPVDHTASQRWFYTVSAGLVSLSDAAFFRALAPLPTTLVLPAGATWGTETNNLQAGDLWDTPRFLVRDRLEAA